MKYPQIPANEAERINALENLQIIDTLPEEEYDNITKIAALICNTPIALITFVGSEKQFFKSSVGTKLTSTLRDFAFCAHALNNPDEILIVNDARKDDRFVGNPLVTENPNIVFYAGMPLVTSQGLALGTICAIDHKPGLLNEDQKNALKSLSQQVIKLLELRKNNLQLQQYQNQLEQYANDMESFAYMASHDLKDPLRMISLFMQKLQKNYGNLLDEKAKDYIEFSIKASEKMTVLVNDLLKYAALDKDNMGAEETNVAELVKEIISYHSAVFEEVAAVIDYDTLKTIKSSRTALKIIFQNLLMNAVKFRKANEALKIKISMEEKPLFWLFTISDNGIGIDSNNFEEIFKPFKSLHPQNIYKGSGLGLAACKKVVEKHGGKMWVQSEVGVGTAFYFEINK